MTDCEFLLALFGLLYALIVAELALKFADAIDLHSERPMGVLTPARPAPPSPGFAFNG